MLPYPSTGRALLDAGLLAKDHLAPCPSSLASYDDLGENVRVSGSKVPGLRSVVVRMTLLRAYRMTHLLARGETADEYLRRCMQELRLGEYLDAGHHRNTLTFVAGRCRSDRFRHSIRASLVFRGRNDRSRLVQMRNARDSRYYPSVRALVEETPVQSLFLAFVRLKKKSRTSSSYDAYLLPRRCLASENVDDRGVVCMCAYKLDVDPEDDAGVKTLLYDDIVSLFVADVPAVRPSASSSSFSLANFPSGRELRDLESLFDDLWLQHLNVRRLGDFGRLDPVRVQMSGGVESLGAGASWWMYGDVIRREVCLLSTPCDEVEQLMMSRRNVTNVVFERRHEVVEVYFSGGFDERSTVFPPLRACVVRHGHPTCLLYTLRLKAGVWLEPGTEDARRLIQEFSDYVGAQAKALTLQNNL